MRWTRRKAHWLISPERNCPNAGKEDEGLANFLRKESFCKKSDIFFVMILTLKSKTNYSLKYMRYIVCIHWRGCHVNKLSNKILHRLRIPFMFLAWMKYITDFFSLINMDIEKSSEFVMVLLKDVLKNVWAGNKKLNTKRRKEV